MAGLPARSGGQYALRVLTAPGVDIDTALAYLDRHINLEAAAGRVEGLSLERMRRLAAASGDPQSDYPVIHVTGTNGKGSTVRMITVLLRAHGLRVGTYTSPHLERINERLAWDGAPIDDATLAASIGDIARLEPALGPDVHLSYFEILTAAAFRWFADLAVDVAVVEVGLLGRWDATNVADATVAVVTNVGRDHTDGRPGWRRAVAEEKAGIVGSSATLVLGETDPELVEVFEAAGAAETWRRHREFGCTANRLALGGRLVDVRTPSAAYDDLFLPVHGAHQGDNAALAIAAVEAFFARPMDDEVITEAFAEVRLPGRFEVVARSPLVVLDGAHNPDGAASLAATLEEGFAPAGRRSFVVGMLEGRDPTEMLVAFGVRPDDRLVVCTPPSTRALSASTVANAATALGLTVSRVDDVGVALSSALAAAAPDDAIIVAGSLYVVGAARAWCRAEGVGLST